MPSRGVLLLSTLGAAAALTWLVREVANKRRLLDRPNERSAHERATPRLGGIGIVSSFIGAAGVFAAREGGGRTTVILACVVAVAALGLVDDLRPLRARTRLAIQLAAAITVVASAWTDLPSRWTILGGVAPTWALALLSVLWVTWLTNLYNFMDGIDGLAGGQAVIASASIAIAAFASGAQVGGVLLLALGAASAGFLLFNFPPASIFMGDVGSTALGFFFGALPFLPGPAFIPVDTVAIALSLFVLDATVTLARRIARRERLSQAHRTHHYQRPLALGVAHRTITLVAYAGMILVGGAAAMTPGLDLRARWALLAGTVGVFAVLASIVVHLERRASRRQRASVCRYGEPTDAGRGA